MSGQRAVFLDRDGVINELTADPRHGGRMESPLRPEDVVLAEGAAEAMAALHAAGYRLLVVSNQPAMAKGMIDRQTHEAVHQRVVELLAAAGVWADDWRYCLHHPDVTGPCDCRKPAPGMLLELA